MRMEHLTTPQAKGPVLGDNQRKALEMLKRMFQEQQDNLTSAGIDKAPLVAIRDWNRAMKEAGIPRNRSMDARATLLDRKLIELEGDCYVRPV